MPTPMRNLRVSDELWGRAQVAAEARGSDLSAEIRAFLERLARNHERRESAAK